jgi:thimet oligopeptidase
MNTYSPYTFRRALTLASLVSLSAAQLSAAPAPFSLWQSAEQVKVSCDAALKGAEQEREAIKKMSEPHLAPLLTRYNKLQLALDMPMGFSGLMFNTHPDEQVREAAQGCEQRLSTFMSALSVDRDLYDRFASIPKAEL